MAKISEVVKLNTGYASAVNLKEEFLDTENNRGRMERYQPVKSHREAFLRLTKSVEMGLTKERCFLLTGNFGTGKSHLMLMLANYLHNTSEEPEIKAFLSNWKDVDPEPVDRLKALRKNKRWMVAICDYGTNEDFEEVVLRAINDACASDREDFQGILDTHYHEAIRKLDNWDDDERNGKDRMHIYPHFIEALQEIEPDYTINKLREELGQHRTVALKAFKRVYKELLLTEEFTSNKSNLVDIIKDFTSSQEFIDRYDGLSILFDEFGYVLENKRISLNIWQDFAEFCNSGDHKGRPCIFVAAAHKSFANYAKGWQEFSKESGRIKEVPLTAEGIEDIIGAMVHPLTESATWMSEVAPYENLMNGFASECKRTRIFDHLDAPTITSKISKGAYPMHPMATYCLLELAKNIGSNNRTAFTFFATEDTNQTGSFPWFITEYNISYNGNLQLYTADLLLAYFSKELSSANQELRGREDLRKVIANYETSLREFTKLASQEMLGGEDRVNEIKKIMSALLILQVVNVPCAQINIAFTLQYTNPAANRALGLALNDLKSKRILFINPISKTYEFASSERVDVEQHISDYISSPENKPLDSPSEMIQVSINRAWPDNHLLPYPKVSDKLLDKDRILMANGHNSEWNEDKRAYRVFASFSDLENPAFYAEQEVYWLHRASNDSFDAVCVYVICETIDEVDKARDSAKLNTSERVLIAVPKEPIPISETIMNLRAIRAVEASSNYVSFSTSDKAHVADLAYSYHDRYASIRNTYLDGFKAMWYGRQGRLLVQQPNSSHHALDIVMDELYTKRNRTRHDEFNKSHQFSLGNQNSMKNKSQIKDAIDALLTAYKPIEINGSFGDDKGQIKYLRKVLFQSQALIQVGTPAHSVMECQLEFDESKYAPYLPALADMKAQVNGLGEYDRLFIAEVVEKYIQPPYGLGSTALLMYFSCLIRMSGDQLVVKREQSAAGHINITDFNILWDILSGKSPGAYIQRRPVSDQQRALLNNLFSLYTGQPASVSDKRSVYEVYDSINRWWVSQPPLSKVKSIYGSDNNDMVKSFIDLMAVATSLDPAEFIFHQLQQQCGYAADDMIDDERSLKIVQCMKQVKQNIEETPSLFKTHLLDEIRAVFGIDGVTYDACRTAISDWCNKLDENQHDQAGSWHNTDSRALIQNLITISDVESTLFSKLPKDFSLGMVADWSTDKTQDYIAKLRSGMKHIYDNAIKVEAPVMIVNGVQISTGPDGKYQIPYTVNAAILIKSPKQGVTVLLTDNGDDPRNHAAQVLPITDPYMYQINGGNKTLRLVSRDTQCNDGKLLTVQFIDQLDKYVVQPSLHRGFKGTDEMVNIVLPVDPNSFLTSVRSLTSISITDKALDHNQAAAMLRKLADELDENPG
ncbi:MAG: hypothetical protein ACYC1M_18540 [Armatimonadota bacterium]